METQRIQNYVKMFWKLFILLYNSVVWVVLLLCSIISDI